MRFLKGLFWLLLAVALLGLALYLAIAFQLSDRLTALFLQAQPWLPVEVSLELFLVAITALCVILVLLIILGYAGLSGWAAVQHQRKLAEAMAAKREVDRLQERHARQYEQLLGLGQALSKQLDKRVLVQNTIEAASRMSSVPQANSIVSLWMLHFETDTFRFERGFYCDETMFVKTAFQPSETPFARIIASQQPWLSARGQEEGLAFVKREKAVQLGAATAVMLVPLVIEHGVLGILIIFCHPDVVKGYEEQRPFYNAVWAQLTLALAIAVQGEVAILDRLTGVHNREYFMKRLIQEIERANRYQLPLSLLMVDIDNFKLVNDMLGHPQGDAVLKIISKLLRKAVRAIDLIGRYGGEEFIVMLPETGYGDEAGGATVVAERIRKAVDDEFRGLQKPLDLTVSVGVACRRFPEDRTMSYQDLIRLADDQLYRAKTTGKNKVCVLAPEKPQEVKG
jgi:diguanylate cyclase (GGDEF)-like protein